MEEFKISNRLKTVADLVIQGNTVADIGTDHGYLPIYLVKEKISDKVIAMDVRKGPLSKAENNIQEYDVGKYIHLRLSNGLEKLEYGEVDTITICGMGGKLMKQILDDGITKLKDGMQLILSPQSELSQFRIYLRNNNIHINREFMIKEDSQYYVIMDCVYNKVSQMAKDRYGEYLLKEKNIVLKEFLYRENDLNQSVIQKLKKLENQDAALSRIKDLEFERAVIEEALKYYN